MKKICVITGTRAEYGILRPLMQRIKNNEHFDLQIIATGMHLSPEFGLTYKYIEKDGFEISEKIEILMSSDTSIGVSKSMGLSLISFSEVYQRLNPDVVVILGDRYEAFSAMASAVVAKIPVAHIHGGELTEGAYDEFFRHAMTKMSHIHFTASEDYRKRVIQMGESPDLVFNVGAMGLENARTIDLLNKPELEKKLDVTLGERYCLVVFHPETLGSGADPEFQMQQLINALNNLNDINIVIIKGNSDTNGRTINLLIDSYMQEDNVFGFTSLAIEDYLSLLKNSDLIIGNSSSGIIEAPYFKIPTVNIGDRQGGRVQAKSIINCEPSDDKILTAIKKAFSLEFKESLKDLRNPYGEGNTSEDILDILKEFLLNNKFNSKKKFYDIKFEM
ncbi:UDP-N-acetylglucosamine 2-epimerase [Methanococcus maripaludis KA1]|jgi:GDP/UDP-N,N'-diacetylbacillosamine 2-epimerase (hydrolysing)|uniref:UDP-N-acetylglucosamine 2-epimerase n=1 Tax=Methanococcus maripaludis KA1 TaxID=637914 RepID=A0A2Z5PLU4_METMI|nr:UDP-N-acetylglucosamine 2-epimerase [Methanococcus maripaludis]BAP60494.1 UDP-N-acetylglucosamine 2-epimerase [Methanococcus maripaludis KA1]